MEISFPQATAETSSPKAATQPADISSQSLPIEGASSRIWQRLFVLAVFAMVMLMVLRPFYMPVINGDHYVYLAEHLVHGELSVNDIPAGYSDVITWQGDKYLPFGPLPAVLLVPFLPLMHLLGTRESSLAAYLLTLLNVLLLARILKQIGISDEQRKWALLLMFGGTVYFSMAVVAATWYFAHIVATTCLLLAITEALGKKRMLLVGLCLGLAEATRFDLLFALPFFVWAIWQGRNVTQDNTQAHVNWHDYLSSYSLIRYAALLGGLTVPLLLVLGYNYGRFGSPFENGYGLAAVTSPMLAAAYEGGFFSLAHLPKNLFALLLQGPLPYPAEDAATLQFPYMQPSPWGMSILLTSPAILYAFRAKWKEPLVRACWVTTIAIGATLLPYYWTGFVQFGYRYALDFIPFLLLLVALGLPKPLTAWSRVLILISVAVNIWGAIFLAKWI